MKLVSPASEMPRIKRNRTNAFGVSDVTVFLSLSVFAAFLIRFILFPCDSVIGWDGVYYATLGEKMVFGDIYGGISAYWSPLYSSLTGVFFLFFQSSETAGRYVSLLVGTLLVIPAYFLFRDLYGRTAAYLGTVLIIIHPMLIRSSVWVMTESLYTLLFITAILVGWHALRRQNRPKFFITGVLFGLAYLVKPEVIGFVGLFFLLTIGVKFFRRNLDLQRLATGYSLLLAGFLILVLPYVVFVHQKTGRWTISQKLLNNVSSVHLEKGDLALIDDGQITLKDRLFRDVYETQNQTATAQNFVPESSRSSYTERSPVSFKGTALSIYGNLKREIKSFLPETFPFIYLFVLFALIGFVYNPWTKRRTERELYLFSFFISIIIGYAATSVQARYLIPVIPLVIGWVSSGIVGFGEWITKFIGDFLQTQRKVNPLFAQIFALLLLVGVLLISFPHQMSLEKAENLPLEEKQAGLWIKRHSNSTPYIMAASPIAPYYAGANYTFLPREKFTTVLDYAKLKKVDFLIFNRRRFSDTPDAFPPDEQGVPGQLELVYLDEQNLNNKITIYRLLN